MRNKGIFSVNPAVFITNPITPPILGFLLNDAGGYILQSNGGRIIIEIGVLNKIKSLNERFEKLMSKIL